MDSKDTVHVDISQLTGDIVAVMDDKEELKSKGLFPPTPAAAKKWLSQKRQSVKPWKQFMDFGRFHVPKNLSQATTRVVKNVEHYQSNYLFVFLGLILYCILTSPLLLIAIAAAMGGAYIVRLKSAEGKLRVFNKELTAVQQYCLVGMMCFPIFYLAGAGAAVFWVIGASFFTIMLHATMYAIEDVPEEGFQLESQTI